MKTLTLMLAGLGIAAAAVPAAASAQQYGNWQGINARQARIDARIDGGIRSGQLTRREAYRLRTDFRALAQLENRYRAGGLNNWERRDLDRRFDVLSARVRFERHDRQDRRR